jgi:hypothetical protein
MRTRYAARGEADRRSVISVDDVVLWAEAILEAYAAEDAMLVVPEPTEQPAGRDPRD